MIRIRSRIVLPCMVLIQLFHLQMASLKIQLDAILYFFLHLIHVLCRIFTILYLNCIYLI